MPNDLGGARMELAPPTNAAWFFHEPAQRDDADIEVQKELVVGLPQGCHARRSRARECAHRRGPFDHRPARAGGQLTNDQKVPGFDSRRVHQFLPGFLRPLRPSQLTLQLTALLLPAPGGGCAAAPGARPDARSNVRHRPKPDIGWLPEVNSREFFFWAKRAGPGRNGERPRGAVACTQCQRAKPRRAALKGPRPGQAPFRLLKSAPTRKDASMKILMVLTSHEQRRP